MTDSLTRRRLLATSAAGFAGGLAGCMGGDGSGEDGMTSDGMAGDDGTTGGDGKSGDGTMSTVAYDLTNLPELSEGTYEGWAIFGDEKLSTGTFSAGDELTFETERSLSEANKIVVTIEPTPDPKEGPSGIPILAGKLQDGMASLSFPVELNSATGSYILNTPTADSKDTPESGLWFLSPGDGGPSASLDLPELPAGWVYEGWAVNKGVALTTGRFSDPAAADDFDGYSGPSNAPPFPGEDFLQNAPDGIDFPISLDDGKSKAVVSVEPDMDGVDPTGEKPFAIKPLVGSIPEDAEIGMDYDLAQNLGDLPSGTATLK